jgi:hypothetical protein
MNTRFLKTLSVRAALVLGGLSALSLAADAQSPTARATVPFEFAAGGAMMPAGEYTIEMPDLSGVIFLHGTTSTAKLIFERRDGMVYLSSVELPGETAQLMSVFKHVTKGAVAAAIH